MKIPATTVETKALLGLAAVGVWLAYRVRNGLSVPAALSGVADLFGAVTKESASGYAEGADYFGNLPAGVDSPLEQATAVVARAFGAEDPASATSEVDRPADESAGPFLGAPKNLLGVSGVIRWPTNGTHVDTQLASDTFPIDAAIENQGEVPRTGAIEIVIREKSILGNWNEARVSAGVVTLAPGEFRQVSARAPNAVDRPFSPTESNARLRFANYTLDSVVFRRTYSLL